MSGSRKDCSIGKVPEGLISVSSVIVNPGVRKSSESRELKSRCSTDKGDRSTPTPFQSFPGSCGSLISWSSIGLYSEDIAIYLKVIILIQILKSILNLEIYLIGDRFVRNRFLF